MSGAGAGPASDAAGAVRVGVISDTHGLLRPEALEVLAGVDLILHAGDVGPESLLRELEGIAPVRAVRGNVDREPWCVRLPVTDVVQAGGATVYMLHDVGTLDLDPAAAGFDVVVFGHSHRPSAERRDGVLYLNPGSAGPRRFSLLVTLAILEVHGKELRSRLVTLV